MLHRRDWLDALEGAAGYTGARGRLHGWAFWGWQKGETELREGLGEVGGRSEKTERDEGCPTSGAWGGSVERCLSGGEMKAALGTWRLGFP